MEPGEAGKPLLAIKKPKVLRTPSANNGADIKNHY